MHDMSNIKLLECYGLNEDACLSPFWGFVWHLDILMHEALVRGVIVVSHIALPEVSGLIPVRWPEPQKQVFQ